MTIDEIARFTPVGRGRIAAVATTLEMRARPVLRPHAAAAPDVEIVDPGPMTPEDYLALFRRIGAAHLWYSRLVMARDDLAAILADPATVLRVCRANGADEGILELDFSQAGSCEIKYFGVTPALQGTGTARRLMNAAIRLAFDRGVERLWLHTNTIDHPRAMEFYRRTGFVPVHQEVEIAPDPRLSGLLPRDAAPHVPIFD